MKVAIASDHAGFELKQELSQFVSRLGHNVFDLGAENEQPSDYPDFAAAVGEAIMSCGVERGILICGSGVGASVAANKMPGVRAATCHDTYSAHQGVEHDDMNVLVIGARVIGSALAHELTRSYLNARFDAGEERFVRRLNKVKTIEQNYMRTIEPRGISAFRDESGTRLFAERHGQFASPNHPAAKREGSGTRNGDNATVHEPK
jgi:ribose 5-phosphate isomerase B